MGPPPRRKRASIVKNTALKGMATESSGIIPEITISIIEEYKKDKEDSEVGINSKVEHVVLQEPLGKEVPWINGIGTTEDRAVTEDHFKENLREEDPSTTKPNPSKKNGTINQEDNSMRGNSKDQEIRSKELKDNPVDHKKVKISKNNTKNSKKNRKEAESSSGTWYLISTKNI